MSRQTPSQVGGDDCPEGITETSAVYVCSICEGEGLLLKELCPLCDGQCCFIDGESELVENGRLRQGCGVDEDPAQVGKRCTEAGSDDSESDDEDFLRCVFYPAVRTRAQSESISADREQERARSDEARRFWEMTPEESEWEAMKATARKARMTEVPSFAGSSATAMMNANKGWGRCGYHGTSLYVVKKIFKEEM